MHFDCVADVRAGVSSADDNNDGDGWIWISAGGRRNDIENPTSEHRVDANNVRRGIVDGKREEKQPHDCALSPRGWLTQCRGSTCTKLFQKTTHSTSHLPTPNLTRSVFRPHSIHDVAKRLCVPCQWQYHCYCCCTYANRFHINEGTHQRTPPTFDPSSSYAAWFSCHAVNSLPTLSSRFKGQAVVR